MLYEMIKRVLDIVLAAVLIIVFSPIFIVAAVAILMESPGVLFFTPVRVGKDGKLFKMYKFRSMVENAEEILHSNKNLLDEYKKNSYKLPHDPRITRVGRFIRKYSIDEMPQFLNVLKGEMSIVGPRAYLPNELIEQQKVYPDTKKYVKSLLFVKPGITGFWQVSGRSEINFDKRIQMDAEYAEKRSICYDIWIIAKTPMAMITGKGAV